MTVHSLTLVWLIASCVSSLPNLPLSWALLKHCFKQQNIFQNIRSFERTPLEETTTSIRSSYLTCMPDIYRCHLYLTFRCAWVLYFTLWGSLDSSYLPILLVLPTDRT